MDLRECFSICFQGLVVDQTIEKVSFCAPDRNHEKGFAYICRDGTTRRWICHGFLALKETVSVSISLCHFGDGVLASLSAFVSLFHSSLFRFLIYTKSLYVVCFLCDLFRVFVWLNGIEYHLVQPYTFHQVISIIVNEVSLHFVSASYF